jgi:hypothetical protein
VDRGGGQGNRCGPRFSIEQGEGEGWNLKAHLNHLLEHRCIPHRYAISCRWKRPIPCLHNREDLAHQYLSLPCCPRSHDADTNQGAHADPVALGLGLELALLGWGMRTWSWAVAGGRACDTSGALSLRVLAYARGKPSEKSSGGDFVTLIPGAASP